MASNPKTERNPERYVMKQQPAPAPQPGQEVKGEASQPKPSSPSANASGKPPQIFG